MIGWMFVFAVDAAGLHIGDDELPVSVARKSWVLKKSSVSLLKRLKRALEAEKHRVQIT